MGNNEGTTSIDTDEFDANTGVDIYSHCREVMYLATRVGQLRDILNDERNQTTVNVNKHMPGILKSQIVCSKYFYFTTKVVLILSKQKCAKSLP